MATTIQLRDTDLSGQTLHEWSIEFLTELIDVRELIRSRVYQEVQDYNQKKPEVFRGLVAPTDAEATLNGFRLKSPRKIDWKEQFERAIEAFEKSQVLILVNDQQVESLDEQIAIAPKTDVSFLRLTPLVGG